MTDQQIAEIMGWPKRYGNPPCVLARVRAVIDAAVQEERGRVAVQEARGAPPANGIVPCSGKSEGLHVPLDE